MNRRSFLLACACAGALGRVVHAAVTPRVVFLNPGEPVERGTGPFWRTVAHFMGVAGRALGMELEVLWGERDHLLMLRQAKDLAARSDAPDYVIIVNEKQAARDMLEMFRQSPSKVFVIHNDITPEQRREIGNERERIDNWIGTAVTNSARGAYLVMMELYRQLGPRDPRVIVINGDPNTPVTWEWADGVKAYMAAAGRGQIVQEVFGDWSYAAGEEKAGILLSRYPEANIIWASNDSMALGALRAARARGNTVLVGGEGGWKDALASIAEGGLAATAVSDFFIGAWAIVMLYDYHNGIDFAAHGGAHQRLDYLHVVNRDNVARFEDAVFKREGALDFSLYSKALHPRPGPYEFSVEHLIHTAQTAGQP